MEKHDSISVDLIKASEPISNNGEIEAYIKPIYTLLLKYPRIIHSEFMTHRVFSRNASSSRAIPFNRTLTTVLDDPFIPQKWLTNKKGMQGGDELPPDKAKEADEIWKTMLAEVARGTAKLNELGVHKHWVNRPLETWSTITVLVTSTEWKNFFFQRDDSMAAPEIEALAKKIRNCVEDSGPLIQKLGKGEWHLPFVDSTKPIKNNLDQSAARCASTSYNTVEGHMMDGDKARDICAKLTTDHWHPSPFEHQATPDFDLSNRNLWGNFRGWIQRRKVMERSNSAWSEESEFKNGPLFQGRQCDEG